MTTQESLAKVAQQLGGGGGGGIGGANGNSPAPVWVQVSQGVHSLNCALDEQRDKPMDADEVSEHDQQAALSYLAACLLPHLGGSARRAARARERVESRVTSSGTRGLTHRWSPPLEPGGYVSGWRVHLCNIHGRNGLYGLNSRRGHQLHFGIVRLLTV